MRTPFFGANWKMNSCVQEANTFFKEWLPFTKGTPNPLGDSEVVIFPPMFLLAYLSETLKGNVRLGAQNMYCESNGAFTGETSAAMLLSSDIPYVLIGHSERRKLFLEEDGLIHKKISHALKFGLKVVLCVGEPLSVREKGLHKDYVHQQLLSSLQGVALQKWDELIIAYEPIWAIGAGIIPPLTEITGMHAFIREVLNSFALPSHSMRIIYGGSVNPSNAHGIIHAQDVDGTLVGLSSLNANDFYKIVTAKK